MNRIKQHLLSLCFCISIVSFSQNNTEIKFELLPSPQQFEIMGVSSLKYDDVDFYYSEDNLSFPASGQLLKGISKEENLKKAELVFSIDNSLDLNAEGYKMTVAKNKITIVGKDAAGVFYGVKTLEQLMQDAKDQNVFLPMCEIIDAPKLSYRAIQLDIKHHLDKTSYYYDLIDHLSSYKINAIIVEMEDKLKYESHPKIGSDDALTIKEWVQLSDYAKERNIEISPLIQGLGHASFVLKHEEYKELRDDPESDWAFNPLDPKTYEIQFDLYRDAIKATPHGKYLHVGGDEVHTTGRNSGKSSLELQLDWLGKVSEFAEKHNRIPIFWDDMPLKHAGVYKPMFNTKLSQKEVDAVWKKNEHKLFAFLDQFPKNCIYMRWNYHTPEALGNTKAMQWFIDHDLKVMGAAAGQTRWVLMPQREGNIKEIKTFAQSSIESGLDGLLLTLWDDDSPHFELYKRGIIAFSEYTWSGNKRSKEELKSAYRHREFSFELSAVGNAFIDDLEGPVAFWKNVLLKGNTRNKLKKNTNAIENLIIDLPFGKKGVWSDKYKDRIKKATEVVNLCDDIAVKINAMKSKTKRNIYTLEIYEQVLTLVQFSSNALLDLEKYDLAKNDLEKEKALKNLKNLSVEFEKTRTKFEEVYGRTRILAKPSNYILDQDYHNHLANQSINFDWQFYAEMLFLEKVKQLF